jgi:hypothetical protein
MAAQRPRASARDCAHPDLWQRPDKSPFSWTKAAAENAQEVLEIAMPKTSR